MNRFSGKIQLVRKPSMNGKWVHPISATNLAHIAPKVGERVSVHLADLSTCARSPRIGHPFAGILVILGRKQVKKQLRNNMNPQLKIEVKMSNPAPGKFVPIQHVSWTPGSVSMRPDCRFPSTWRDPVGKPLTNGRITRLMRDGWYGPDAKQAVEARIARTGIIYRCSCGQIATGFYRFSYLPKQGNYCTLCVKRFRAERDKAKELDRKWKENLEQEFV
jgi:hypothetical protein